MPALQQAAVGLVGILEAEAQLVARRETEPRPRVVLEVDLLGSRVERLGDLERAVGVVAREEALVGELQRGLELGGQ